MKTYNEVQEQIEKLENTIVELKKQSLLLRGSFMSDNIDNQIKMISEDIKTLKWVIS